MVVWWRSLLPGLTPGSLDLVPWLPGEGTWLPGFSSWYAGLDSMVAWWKDPGCLDLVPGCLDLVPLLTSEGSWLLGYGYWFPRLDPWVTGEGSWLPGFGSWFCQLCSMVPWAWFHDCLVLCLVKVLGCLDLFVVLWTCFYGSLVNVRSCLGPPLGSLKLVFLMIGVVSWLDGQLLYTKIKDKKHYITYINHIIMNI